MRKVITVVVAFALTMLGLAPTTAQAATTAAQKGSAHVQNVGWMPMTDGIIGTTGKSLRMEALRLPQFTPVFTSAHVQNIGWMNEVDTSEPDNFAGTTGRSLRLEALRFRVDDMWARSGAHFECQAHVQNIGWMNWVRDDQVCGTTGRSLRLEAVRLRLVVDISATPTPTATPTQTATPTPTTTPAEAVRVAFTADTGIDDPAGHAVLGGVGQTNPDIAIIGGDFAYQPGREADYCALVKSKINAPVLLLPGNHEAQNGDGLFSNFISCLPDKVGVNGDYSTGHWFVDRGNLRLIGMSPNIALPQGNRSYSRGTAEREQVKDWIDDAKAQGKKVVVAMHITCVTVGIHGREMDSSVVDMLIGKKVDLVLSGHDHNYSRSHLLTGTYGALSAVDRDNSYAANQGTVFATVGNGGHKPRTVTTAGWVAVANGTNSPGGISYGHAVVSVAPTGLSYQYVRDAGAALSDQFSMSQ